MSGHDQESFLNVLLHSQQWMNSGVKSGQTVNKPSGQTQWANPKHSINQDQPGKYLYIHLYMQMNTVTVDHVSSYNQESFLNVLLHSQQWMGS